LTHQILLELFAISECPKHSSMLPNLHSLPLLPCVPARRYGLTGTGGASGAGRVTVLPSGKTLLFAVEQDGLVRHRRCLSSRHLSSLA
jgi:hypothetical protein